MNDQRPAEVSVINPITPAIDRVKLMLFRPFDLGRWFVIGICAWLASLGSGGGGGPRANFPFEDKSNAREAINETKEFFIANLYWIVPLVVFLVLFGIVLWLVLTWLSSRGKFMFLHCVSGNKAEVKNPWRKFREHANSLFAFRIVLALIGFIGILLPIIFTILLIAMMVSAGEPSVGPILGIVLLVLCLIVISICLGLVSAFTKDFVVPIMFLRTTSVRAAWREFLDVLSVNKARFLLYLLFQIVIGIAISAIVFMGMCFTCCCLMCLLAIPVVGTVVFLPVLIFKRAYSLYYLRQYGPQFDVFAAQSPQPELPVNSY